MSADPALEAALQRGWSFGELEVYADHLLSSNDPRGHVVAIDLIPRPEQQTWVQRRRAALAAWLGNTLAARAGHLVQHGFLHELRDGAYPVELLDSPAGAYLRGYTAFGRARAKASLVHLAARPRPWLSRLTIANHGEERLGDVDVRALIAATPRLEDICFLGHPMFGAFPHPAVKRARVDTKCSVIELPIAAQRIDAPDFATGPTVSEDDLELVMELVELAPDCNQLYTYGSEFAEPMPSIIARLAAAKLVELAGPVVRAASPGMAVALGKRRVDLDVPGGRGWIDQPYIDLGMLTEHITFVRDCLATYPVSGRMHDTLVEYCRQWDRNGYIAIEPAVLAPYYAAFSALLELRGLFPSANVGNDAQWAIVERLSTDFGGDRGVYFRRYGW
jgi:hypothetical protein